MELILLQNLPWAGSQEAAQGSIKLTQNQGGLDEYASAAVLVEPIWVVGDIITTLSLRMLLSL